MELSQFSSFIEITIAINLAFYGADKLREAFKSYVEKFSLNTLEKSLEKARAYSLSQTGESGNVNLEHRAASRNLMELVQRKSTIISRHINEKVFVFAKIWSLLAALVGLELLYIAGLVGGGENYYLGYWLWLLIMAIPFALLFSGLMIFYHSCYIKGLIWFRYRIIIDLYKDLQEEVSSAKANLEGSVLDDL